MKFFQKIIIVILLSVIILLPFVFSKNIMESIKIKESLVSDAKQDKIPEPVRLMITPIKNTMKNSFGADGRVKKDALLPFKKAINDYLDNIQNNTTNNQSNISAPLSLMLTPIKNTMKNSFGADGRVKKDAIQPFKKTINDYLDYAENNMTKKQIKDILTSFAAISNEINDSIKF